MKVISASIWTCWTSLVSRVISDGAPNWPTSRAENSLHPAKTAAHVPAHGHRGPGAEVDRADRADDLDQRHREHDAAGPHDVAGVAGDHAVVDDVGVQRGQVQRGQRLHELQQHDHDDRSLRYGRSESQELNRIST